MEPKDFFRVVLRRKRTVITALVVVVGVTFAMSMRKDPTYAASCKVRIEGVGPGGTGQQLSEDPRKNPTEIYASFEEMTQILQSPIMAQRVATRMQGAGVKVDAARLTNRINAAHELNTGIFNLTAVDSDAAFAAKICDFYMVQFIEERVTTATERVQTTKAVLESKLATYDGEIERIRQQLLRSKDQTEYDLLRLQEINVVADRTKVRKDILDLENALEVQLKGGGEVVSYAGASGIKVAPDHKRDAILGLIVGLIFGAGLALVREYMDDTVRDKEAAQRDIGLPVLASMPAARGDDPFAEEDGSTIEAARMLRTNLSSQGLGAEVSCIVVTSTLAKRMPSTLVNLAAAIAEAGRTVLAIGADFRNPRIHEAFGVGNAVGLTNVIRGQVTFEKAIRPVPGQVGVYVMPSGPVIGNPGELLSTDEMAMVIRRARKWADVVLVDAPPVLAAADASVLGTYADGVLLVMSAGQTPRAQATEAKEQLKAAGARLLGAVMFGASDGSGGKVLSLPVLRRDDDDLMPPLSPYGGGFDDGGYGFGGSGGGYGGGYGGAAYGGGGYGGTAYGGGGMYGGYGAQGGFDAGFGYDPYGSYDDVEGYDAGDDAPAPRARARSPRGNGAARNGAARNGGKSGAKKKKASSKTVAAKTSERIRREDRAVGRAPRNPGARRVVREELPAPAPAPRSGRAASNGRSSGKSRATGSGAGRSSEYGRTSRPRTNGARSAGGRKGSGARPSRPSRSDRDLF